MRASNSIQVALGLISVVLFELSDALIVTSVVAGDKKFKTISFDSKFLPALKFEKDLPIPTEFRRHRTVHPPKFDVDVNIPIKLPMESEYDEAENYQNKKPIETDLFFQTSEITEPKRSYKPSSHNQYNSPSMYASASAPVKSDNVVPLAQSQIDSQVLNRSPSSIQDILQRPDNPSLTRVNDGIDGAPSSVMPLATNAGIQTTSTTGTTAAGRLSARAARTRSLLSQLLTGSGAMNNKNERSTHSTSDELAQQTSNEQQQQQQTLGTQQADIGSDQTNSWMQASDSQSSASIGSSSSSTGQSEGEMSDSYSTQRFTPQQQAALINAYLSQQQQQQQQPQQYIYYNPSSGRQYVGVGQQQQQQTSPDQSSQQQDSQSSESDLQVAQSTAQQQYNAQQVSSMMQANNGQQANYQQQVTSNVDSTIPTAADYAAINRYSQQSDLAAAMSSNGGQYEASPSSSSSSSYGQEFIPGGYINLHLKGPEGGPKMTYADYDRERWAQQLSQAPSAMPYPILSHSQLQNYYAGLGTFTNGLSDRYVGPIGLLEKLKSSFHTLTSKFHLG